MTEMRARTLHVLALAVASLASAHADPGSLASTLRALYPATTFGAIEPTPVPGVMEVVMGEHVAYVEPSGRYFFFGRLFDMQAQRDLTEVRLAQLASIDFARLPLELAIPRVAGTGRRVVAVFSDPDCPHCRALEQHLEALDDVTVYTFLYPIEALHPGARALAVSVWCAPDRSRAWRDLMLRNVTPAEATCAHPVDRLLDLGAVLRIQGTPTLFSGDGRRLVGAHGAATIDRWLAGETRAETEHGQ